MEKQSEWKLEKGNVCHVIFIKMRYKEGGDIYGQNIFRNFFKLDYCI